jgi:hypothetical protein
MTITKRTRLSVRGLLLAGALALALIPVLESRASAAPTTNYFCGSYVLPNSYCTKSSAWGPPTIYGFFTSATVEGESGFRKCAILIVYSNTSGLEVARFKNCGTNSHHSVAITSQYNNPWLYGMFAHVYNGSSQKKGLLGWAIGNRR